MTKPLGSRDMLFLLEMCLDAEDRCAERALAARQRGDRAGADRELALRARYARLRDAILGHMGGPDASREALARGIHSLSPAEAAARPSRASPLETRYGGTR